MSVGVLGREEPIEGGESGKGERREHQSGEGGVEGGVGVECSSVT